MNGLRVLALVLWAAISMPAQAHAFLEHADPPVGARVAAAPGRLTLKFSQQIEAAFSSVKVTDAKGRPVDKGDVRVQGPLVQVSLGTLGPGDYKVTWRVVSKDAHVTKGDFAFHVGP
jgi:methionine-rich copper-binding protein CopC